MGVEATSMDALVDRYYEPLFRFARSLSAAEDSAADLTQETFYLWVAKGHQLRDASKVKGWLFTTLYREFLRQRRHHDRFPHHEMSAVEGDLPVIESSVVDALDADQVLKALQRVEEVFRVPLTLFYVDDFSYREIAETLELPLGTVMSRLSRGKAQLRYILASARAEPEPKVIPFRRAATS